MLKLHIQVSLIYLNIVKFFKALQSTYQARVLCELFKVNNKLNIPIFYDERERLLRERYIFFCEKTVFYLKLLFFCSSMKLTLIIQLFSLLSFLFTHTLLGSKSK